MTESEAVKEFQQNIDLPFGSNVSKEAAKMAIQALEEVQRNRKHRRVPCVERKAEDTEETDIYCKFRLYSIMVMPSMRKKNNQK